MITAKSIRLILFFCLGILITSCGTKKSLYRPNEVADLSNKLGIEIRNDDPNIPLYAEVSSWLGVKYRYGGNSRSGTDCSGFTQNIYRDVYNKKLSRSSNDQSKNDVKNISKNKLQTGDLVFFATNSKKKNTINHVGIYLKDSYFVHASTKRGVVVSSLNQDYYKRTWKKGGRVK
ncbi:C40 family peptidase [Dysgonomonas sp. 520]|uniref:C40 family peptidase n=1 Tax=Dysgonomonas sp. 520 TaxID=2302931 RepID=UPI0013D28E9A|nr:NlpC/P60 family protein [Dysgonomonas sp. 520]NDW09418.1 NlpC/P60 family protein [Dysgonomonas sp. 520]